MYFSTQQFLRNITYFRFSTTDIKRHFYNASVCCLLVLGLIYGNGLEAQTIAQYSFAATSGTYTALTGATAVTVSAADDGYFNGIPIGFTFPFAGTNYTHAHVSTNGWLTLGTSSTNNVLTASTAGNSFAALGKAPTIAPLWDDLAVTTTTTDISYSAPSGTTPNRVMTIQYNNIKWNYQAAGTVISFQVKLYESGKIDFVYSQGATAYNAGTTGGASIGIASASGTYQSLNNSGTAPTVSTTTNTTNIATKPATGQTYTFSPPFTSIANGAWSSASTWNLNAVPSASSIVTVNHTVTAGALTRNAGIATTIGTAGTLAVSGTYTNNGTTTVNGAFQLDAGGWATGASFVYGAAGTLIFNNTTSYGVSSADVYWPTTSGPFNVTVLQGGFTLNSANRTIAGTLQTASGVTLTTSTLTLNGTCRINSGGFFNNAPIYGASSTLIYNTTGTFGRGNEWSAVGTIASTAGYPNHVQISNNTTLNLGNGGTGTARQCNGNLTIDDGSSLNMATSAMTAALTVGGNVTLGSAATANLTLSTSVGGDLIVKGNWTRNGTSTLTNNSRQVTFNGTVAQTLTGNTTFDYFKLNNAAGLTLQTTSPITINNQMDLTSGKVTIGANNLTLGSAATLANNGASNYVVTNSTGALVRNGVTTAATVFPIGTTANYTPLTLTNTTSAPNISASVGSTITNAVADATKIVNLQWNILSSAVTTSAITYQWNTANHAASFSAAAACDLGTYTTGPYSAVNLTTPSGANPYTLTRTGQSLPISGNNYCVIGNANAIACVASSIPYNEGFEGITVANTLPSCMVASPAVASGGKNQTYITTGVNSALVARTGSKYAAVYYSPNAAGYFFSVPLQLTGGTSYTASVYYKTDGIAWPTVGLKYGTVATIVGMTNSIASVSNGAATSYTLISGAFTPATTGVYYVAFFADNTSTNAPNYAAFDDFGVIVTPAAPTITSFTPSSACASVGTTTVITGTNFTGATSVTIGGTAAAAFTVNSATQITATIGAGTTGTIAVITPGGTATSAGTFTVNTTPTTPTANAATSLAGTSFAANWSTSTGATAYLLDVSTVNTFASFVSGYNNFNVGNVLTYNVTGLSTSTTYYYRVRATNAGGCTTVSSGIITAVTTNGFPSINVPATGNNSVNCGVSTNIYDEGGSTGNYVNNDNGYTVLNNSGTGVITLTGTYTTEASWDFLKIYSGVGTGGALLGSYSGSGTIPTVTSAAGSPITVQFTSDGSGVDVGIALTATYTGVCAAAPTVSSFTPSNACASAGATVVITGTNFTGATSVTIGGTTAVFTVNSATQITATVGAGTTGTIAVTTGGGTGTSGSSFTVNPAQAIPTVSTATSLTTASFSANWAASVGATSYRLDVSTVNTFASFLTGYNDLNVGNVLTYSVTGLSASTIYYYRVRAVASCTSASSTTGSATTLAAPPSNDACANAVTITPINAISCTSSVSGTTFGSTQDGPSSTCATSSLNDVWYSFTADGLSSYNIAVTNTANDLVLELFSGTCASPVSISCVDGPAVGTEIITTTILAAGTYRYRVFPYNGLDATFTTCVYYTPPPAYKAQFISMNTGASTWCAGETRTITVTVKNVGTAAWTNSGPDINIGVKWNTNGTSWADYYVRTDANGLASGATGTFSFTLTASNATASNTYGSPLAAGTNNITFDLVNEGNCWFANNTGACGPGNSVYASSAITINPLPTGVSAGTDVTICSGTTTTLNGSANSPTTPAASSYIFSTTTGVSLENLTTGATSLVGFGVDDAASGVTTIPFSFSFGGINYTQFSASSNGLMALGATAVSTSSQTGVTITGVTPYPVIAPWWDDNHTASSGNVQYKVVGTTPNRKLVVEWNVRTFSSESGNYTKTAQVWLFETSNIAEIVYGTGTSITYSDGSQIGIASSASSYQGINTTAHTASISVTNNGQTTWPGSGRAYIFTPPPPTYAWTPSATLSAANISNPVATPTSTTTYTMTATFNGCSVFDNVDVNVTPLPSGGTITGATPVCDAQTGVNYTINGVSSVTSYNWVVPSGASITAGQGTASLSVSWGATSGNIVCTPINSGCNGTAVNYAVVVNSLSTNPTSITSSAFDVCNGGTVNMSVNGGSLGTGASWKWYSASCGGTLVGTGVSVSLVPTTTTTYFVRAEGTCNNSICVNYGVNVFAQPSISSVTSPLNPICPGGNATVSVAASGGGGSIPIAYQWQYNNGGTWGNVVAATPTGMGYTNNTATSMGVSTTNASTPTGNYEYRCIVSSTGTGCNTATSGAATVTVNAEASAPTASMSPAATPVCVGATLTLATPTLGTGGAGTQTIEYSTTSSSAGFSSTVPNVSAVSVSSYNIWIRTSPNASGCDASSATQYTWSAVADATISTSVPNLCSETTVSIASSLTGGTGSGTYQWLESASGSGTTFTNVSGGSGATSATYTTPALNAPKFYQVVYTPSTAGCDVVSSPPVVLDIAPSATLSTSVTNVLCNGNATGAIDLSVTNMALTIDGNITEGAWGQAIATSAGGPANGFAAGHEANAIYAINTTSDLYLAIAGNVQSGNKILTFIDSKSGGYTTGNFGRTSAPQGIDDFNSGTTFDNGFAPDYALIIGTDGSGNYFWNLYTLSGTAGSGGGPDTYLGDNSSADLHGNPANGSNTRGFEMKIAKSALGNPSGAIGLMTMYISEAGFLNNQFLTRAGSAQGSFTAAAVNFNNEPPNPIWVTPHTNAPLSYAWSNSATTEDISALTANTYTVTVTTANTCTSTASVTVTQPAQLTATFSDKSDDYCHLNAGQVKITVSGGTNPYNVTWTPAHGSPSPQPQTIATNGGFMVITGLHAATTYNFVVTDNNNCQIP